MRHETKIATGIGIVLVGLGVWYVNSRSDADKKSETPATEIVKNTTEDSATVTADVSQPPIGNDPLVVDTSPPDEPDQAPAAQPAITGTALADASNTPADHTLNKKATGESTPPTISGDRIGLTAVQPAGGTTGRPAGNLDNRQNTNKPVAQKHVIKPGDNYSKLAVQYFGHAKYATNIAKANPGLNPRRLYVGAKLTIPVIPELSPRESSLASPSSAIKPSQPVRSIPADRAYMVEPGENWNILASRFLGNSNRWPELYELNKERVSRNPQMLRPGTTIELPKEALKKPRR